MVVSFGRTDSTRTSNLERGVVLRLAFRPYLFFLTLLVIVIVVMNYVLLRIRTVLCCGLRVVTDTDYGLRVVTDTDYGLRIAKDMDCALLRNA